MPSSVSAPWRIYHYSRGRIRLSTAQSSARRDLRPPLFPPRQVDEATYTTPLTANPFVHGRLVLNANCLVSLGSKRSLSYAF